MGVWLSEMGVGLGVVGLCVWLVCGMCVGGVGGSVSNPPPRSSGGGQCGSGSGGSGGLHFDLTAADAVVGRGRSGVGQG